MYILIAAATHNEVSSTMEWLQKHNGMIHDHEVDVLITGIGSSITSFSLSKQLAWRTPELVIQAGISGSFKEEFPPESIVLVKEEVFADLGAYSDDGFDDIFDLGLIGVNDKPFKNRLLVNPGIERWRQYSLPLVRGATINCISSTRRQVETIAAKYDADVESMEGASLHYVCIMEEVPFIQVRCVSNYAGERDKRKWKMKESISKLNEKIKELLTIHY